MLPKRGRGLEVHQAATKETAVPPEIRDVNPDARYFTPHFNAMMNAEMRRFRERPPELQPTMRSKRSSFERSFGDTSPIARGVAGSPR